MMKFEFDSLKCAKLLRVIGIETSVAEALVEAAATTEIKNLYNKQEVDVMLSESVRGVLDEFRRESDKNFAILEKQIEKNEKEMKSSRRWLGGLIVASSISIAGYLSALIHFTH
jgi:hypothetical protein